MQTFEALKANYVALAAHATIVPAREHELSVACERLIKDKEIYRRVENVTEVPAAALMALAEREMQGNLHCYFGNGQRLTMRTTIVPIGRGPFPDTPDGFVKGCLDAIHLDGLDQVVRKYGRWTLPLFCYESESWNGWGYRARGIPSPYVFGATTVQRPGKFPRDHVFDPNMIDPQLGTLAIVEELIKQDPSLAFDDMPTKVAIPSIVPVIPHPEMTTTNPMWVQSALNKLNIVHPKLLVDGNIGRATRAAVRTFEQRHHLLVDRGIPGPQVVGALKQALAENGLS